MGPLRLTSVPLQSGRHHDLTHDDDIEGDRRILAARARALARPVAVEVERSTALELVYFTVGGERLAIGSQWVRRITPLAGITPIPDLPPAFLGIVHLDGEILPVVDVRVLLGDGAAFRSAQGRAPAGGVGSMLVVVGEQRGELGLAVDEAETIVRVAGWVATPDDPVVSGIVDGQRSVLAGAALLGDPRLFHAEPG